jgi:hypothetical protein
LKSEQIHHKAQTRAGNEPATACSMLCSLCATVFNGIASSTQDMSTTRAGTISTNLQHVDVICAPLLRKDSERLSYKPFRKRAWNLL